MLRTSKFRLLFVCLSVCLSVCSVGCFAQTTWTKAFYTFPTFGICRDLCISYIQCFYSLYKIHFIDHYPLFLISCCLQNNDHLKWIFTSHRALSSRVVELWYDPWSSKVVELWYDLRPFKIVELWYGLWPFKWHPINCNTVVTWCFQNPGEIVHSNVDRQIRPRRHFVRRKFSIIAWWKHRARVGVLEVPLIANFVVSFVQKL